MSMLILYTTDDGKSQIQLRTKDQTVWLTQLEMAELFDATKQNISLHLKNLFEDGELMADSVVKESLTVQTEGSHAQMECNTSALYLHYDQHRKASEAQAADQQDEAALQALAHKIKHRPLS